jgi:hypothetical protein
MRKIIQICAIPVGNCPTQYNTNALYALCNDGSLWIKKSDYETWHKLPDIPQDEDVKTIQLPCLECGRIYTFSTDSPEANGIFNVFCSHKDCEDKWGIKNL